MHKELHNKPLVIVDLNAGRYVITRIGHECYNLVPNELDGRYYGYCPPFGSLDIARLGAAKSDEYIDGVIVVYTQKIKGSSDREIIAFTDNARVYREKHKDPLLGRVIFDEGSYEHCSYSIVSDNLYNLNDYPIKYRIRSSKYSPSLFRGQRVFKGKHPELDKEVLAYLERYLDDVRDEDTLVFQRLVQEENVSPNESIPDGSKSEPQYIVSGGSKAVSKNPRFAKLALLHAGFRCAGDSSHTTFMTAKGVPYMEGHHLIPCTYTNAARFWEECERNIDCEQNIVCLCPTCHRKVHFGSKEERESILKIIFKGQKDRLESAGLVITFDELLRLY